MVLEMADRKESAQTRLEKELARRTRRLSALYAVLTAYHQVDDLDGMMRLALNQILSIAAGSVGSIHLLDKACENLHLAAHQGISSSILEAMRQIPVTNEFFCEIITHQKPQIVTEMAAEPRLAEIAQAGGWDVFIGLPITNGKAAWGVLSIYGDETLHPTTEEIELLEIIAGQIGIAIENSHLRDQAERLAIVDERNRLARELHDSVTQSLYSLTLFAETAQRMIAAGDMAETRRCLTEIADSSQQALKEMRLLVHKLRPSTVPEGGLFASIEQRLRAVEGRSGVKYNFQADKTLVLQPGVENALYAITVEALNNALKYARADQVWVALIRDGNSISLEISDNGSGFDPEQAIQSGGLGLASMRERVAELQGNIQIDSTPGEGANIRVCIPDPSAEAKE
jgi:signal transduction histidine kinase